MSVTIIAELAAKLTEKFDWPPGRVTTVVKELGDTATVVKPRRYLRVIESAKSDNRVLECALEVKADYIVTGDRKHLLPLKEFQGIRILTAASFLRRIGK